MQGYVLLSQTGYALVYLLTAVALTVSTLATALGLVSSGSPVWWPTVALLAVVSGLELHRVYTRRLA